LLYCHHMNDDIISQHEHGLDDLLGAARARQGGKVKVSSDEVEEKLKDKIKEIDQKKKEEEAREQAASLGVGYIFLKGLPVSSDA